MIFHLKKKIKVTSSSDAHWRTEDKVCGSVGIQKPFSFMAPLFPSDSLEIAGLER